MLLAGAAAAASSSAGGNSFIFLILPSKYVLLSVAVVCCALCRVQAVCRVLFSVPFLFLFLFFVDFCVKKSSARLLSGSHERFPVSGRVLCSSLRSPVPAPSSTPGTMVDSQ